MRPAVRPAVLSTQPPAGRPSRWSHRLVAVLVGFVVAVAGVVLVAAPAGAAQQCPCGLFSASQTPEIVDYSDDTSSVELGVRFTVQEPVLVTTLRFYKSAGNVGPHVGSLWDSGGNLLARADYTDETAVGWQQVTLPTPVAVKPGVTYVASYFAPHGHYSVTPKFFLDGPYDAGILDAPGGTGADANGMFEYSPVPTFPTGNYNGNNYFVDVVVQRPVTLSGIAVTPAKATALVGTPTAFSATGVYSDDTTAPLTDGVTWTTSDPSVATVSSSGVVTGVSGGTVTVTAALGSVTGSATYTVSEVTGLTVGGAPASLPKGRSAALTVTATQSAGSPFTPTGATWTSSNPAVATVSPTGQVQTTGVGSTTVQVAYAGRTASTVLTVTPAVVDALTASPSALSVRWLTLPTKVKLTATYSDGTVADVSGKATWTTNNPFVGLVLTSSSTGSCVVPVLPGTATLTASFGGQKATVALTVRL